MTDNKKEVCQKCGGDDFIVIDFVRCRKCGWVNRVVEGEE